MSSTSPVEAGRSQSPWVERGAWRRAARPRSVRSATTRFMPTDATATSIRPPGCIHAPGCTCPPSYVVTTDDDVEAPGYFSTGHMEIALPLDGHRLSRDDPHRVALVCAWAATVVASAIAAAVAASSDTGHPLALALARAAMVGVPAAVGLYAIARGPGERFGAVLVVVGAAWFLTTFAESSEELPYSLGRIAGWFIEVLIVYALLSFPTGRLESHADRLLVRAMGVVLVVFYLPRILFAEHFDVPSPYTSCVADCPRNAFFAVNHEPAFMHAVLRPPGATALALVMTVVAVRLWRRMSTTTPLSRRIFQAVLVIAAVRATLMVVGALMRWISPDQPILESIAWALALAVPALA